jgi:hypothetical protein
MHNAISLNTLLGLLIGVTFLVGYFVFARPMLKATPSFNYFYEQEASLWLAFKMKFDGLKQKILTSLLAAAALIVSMYDAIAPFIVDAGVDPGLLLPKVPPFVWPIAGTLILWLIQTFRNKADKNAAANAAALMDLGEPLAAPAPAVALPVAPVEEVSAALAPPVVAAVKVEVVQPVAVVAPPAVKG